MKQKLSITIDAEKVKQLEKLLKEGRFRNKSHFIEYCILQFLRAQSEQSSDGPRKIADFSRGVKNGV